MGKKKKYLNIVIIVSALSFLAFNDLGIVKLVSIYNQRETIKKEIDDWLRYEAFN